MATIVPFHHVLGPTDGVREFAEQLAADRHSVHVPDLDAGAIADTLEGLLDRLGR